MMMFVTNSRVREKMANVMAAFKEANVNIANAKVSCNECIFSLTC